MSGPIHDAAASPEMAQLLQRLGELLPQGTAMFIVAVGPLDGDTRLREIAVGGALDDGGAMEAASFALAGRGKVLGEIVLKQRMH